MKQLLFILLLIILLPATACTGPISAKAITGKVIDAETGQPIEEAILLVEWTKTRGFGNTYTTSEKAVEVFSDKSGLVKIPGYNVRFVNEPDITVYKPGYVAWNSHSIFIDGKHRVKRTDFKWKNGYIFRLEKFKNEFGYVAHESFVSLCINIGQPNNNKKLLWNIYSQHEENNYLNELRNRKKREHEK